MKAGLAHSVLSVFSASKTQRLAPEFHFQAPFQVGPSRIHVIYTAFTHHRHHSPTPFLKQYTRSLVGNQMYGAQSPEVNLTHREPFLDLASVLANLSRFLQERGTTTQSPHSLPGPCYTHDSPTPSATPPTPDGSIYFPGWKTCGFIVEKGWSSLPGHQCSQNTSVYDHTKVQEY